MSFIKDTVKSFKPIDIAIWLGSIVAIVLAFVLTHNTDYITLTTSLVGATSLIFIAKGNVIGQVICVAFAAFYGAVSFYNRYYGEMITYICMSAPIAVASVVTWLKNPSKSGHAEVKVNTIRGKEYALLALLAAAVTAAFFFILRALGTNELIVSTVSVTTSFVAAYLTMRRSEYYGIAYGANDVVLIVLWTLSTVKNIQYLPMVVCFVIFLINDIYGFINWRRTKRRQQKQIAADNDRNADGAERKMDNTTRFNDRSDAYSAARPRYAQAFIDMLCDNFALGKNTVVADIGSGTGILTKQILDSGAVVYAVEPNAEMRGKAETALSGNTNFRSVDGTAEHATLEAHSVDAVVVGQAFHWFDGQAFKCECNRILKPDGKIFLAWNDRDMTAEINIEQAKLFEKFCPKFTGFSGGIKDNDERIVAFFDGKYSRDIFQNPLEYDKQKFIQRGLSSSYALGKSDANYAEYVDAICALFDKYAIDGVLTIPNKTTVYYGSIHN